MNRMKILNLVYKIKKAKPEKSGVVDRLKMAYISIKRFLKPLHSCKYVNPLHSYYLKNGYFIKNEPMFFKSHTFANITKIQNMNQK